MPRTCPRSTPRSARCRTRSWRLPGRIARHSSTSATRTGARSNLEHLGEWQIAHPPTREREDRVDDGGSYRRHPRFAGAPREVIARLDVYMNGTRRVRATHEPKVAEVALHGRPTTHRDVAMKG